jgi:putative transposase
VSASQLNETRYYPPLNGYKYSVAVALYSKCITVAEATIALLTRGSAMTKEKGTSMSVSRRSEAQITGALKQLEVGR